VQDVNNPGVVIYATANAIEGMHAKLPKVDADVHFEVIHMTKRHWQALQDAFLGTVTEQDFNGFKRSLPSGIAQGAGVQVSDFLAANQLRTAGFSRDAWEDFATLNVVGVDNTEVSATILAELQKVVDQAATAVVGSPDAAVVKVASRPLMKKQAVNTIRSGVCCEGWQAGDHEPEYCVRSSVYLVDGYVGRLGCELAVSCFHRGTLC
jgi:hypothetical protein